jgi:hypothetical protein
LFGSTEDFTKADRGLLKFVVELPGGKEMIFDLDEHTQVEIIEATKCWQ